MKLPDPIELSARVRLHSRGYIAQLERNEAYAAHFSMYGVLSRNVEPKFAYSLYSLALSAIPRIVWPDRPRDIYLYYSESVGTVQNQGYSLHHATGWYLNFGYLGVALGAVVMGLVWGYAITPQDAWDLDEPLITPLIDLEIGGRTVKTAVKAARNGLFYVWDRATGKLVVDPWMHTYQDIIKKDAQGNYVNMTTGLPNYDLSKAMFTDVADRRKYTQADPRGGDGKPADYTGTEITWYPGIDARNWQNDAWSPKTKLNYVSTNNSGGTQVVFTGEYKPGTGYTLRRNAGGAQLPTVGMDGKTTTTPGQLAALDPIGRKIAWEVKWTQANQTPVSATAGDLLLQGGNDKGVFRAMDARDGKILYEFRSGARYNQSPITYLYQGKQYIAVQAGSDANSVSDAPAADGGWFRTGDLGRFGGEVAGVSVPDDYVTIVNVIPGGPAAVSGLVKANDRITAVAQGKAEFTDVVGWRLDDVVQLIRGPAGTVVRLQILPAGASPGSKEQVYEFTRNKITLESQASKKKIETVSIGGRDRKVGVIDVPSFYQDFDAKVNGDKDYRSTTRDVARLIEELKAEKVEGLVIDLRGNGGGNLSEAQCLVGVVEEGVEPRPAEHPDVGARHGAAFVGAAGFGAAGLRAAFVPAAALVVMR